MIHEEIKGRAKVCSGPGEGQGVKPDSIPLFFDEYFEKNGLGFAEEKKVRAGLEMVKNYMGLKGEVDPKETYTNQFVEGVPREWRFPKKPALIK